MSTVMVAAHLTHRTYRTLHYSSTVVMSTPFGVSRSCARYCTQALRLLQPATRFLSISSPRSYAQHTDLPSSSYTEATPQTEIPFSETQSSRTQQPPSPPSSKRTYLSHIPSQQNQPPPTHLYTGTVTRTSTMSQTVQITRHHQVWDKFLQKYYTRPLRLKAHDPHPPTYLREGDVVEYGPYTAVEREAKVQKNRERVQREEKRLGEADATGKMLRKFRRDEATRDRMKGRKVRGVQVVVRRVVTPFGVALDERMERLSGGEEGRQEPSRQGGQDSLLAGKGGNLGRASGRASVAG